MQVNVCAPYSQGNVEIFGLNAGKQCVAMSCCALIYNTIKPITDSVHLTEIMTIGNELYSVLARSTGQTYLLLTELPNKLRMLDHDYQLEFSDSF